MWSLSIAKHMALKYYSIKSQDSFKKRKALDSHQFALCETVSRKEKGSSSPSMLLLSLEVVHQTESSHGMEMRRRKKKKRKQGLPLRNLWSGLLILCYLGPSVCYAQGHSNLKFKLWGYGFLMEEKKSSHSTELCGG